MRRTTGIAYAGRYDGPRAGRELRAGAIERTDTVICAAEGCSTTVRRARLR